MPNTAGDESLFALLNELAASTRRAMSAVDRAIAQLDEAEQRRSELDAAALSRASAEFGELDPELLADIYEAGMHSLSQ